MNSFYGGIQGQSLYIKTIFTSKNGPSDSLRNDLSLGWASPIGENELVAVSYGLPSDSNYNIYRQIDIDAENKSFNSTLWLKCYDETPGTTNGWYYKLVASMTGNTPKLQVDQNVIILDANETPKVDINGDPDAPILVFSLPQSQVLSVIQPSNILGPSEDPFVIYDEKKNINRPTLLFNLPRAVKFYYGDLLGQFQAGTYQEAIEDGYKVGDYYINKATGRIYLITAIDEANKTGTYKYEARIQAPLPQLSVKPLSPFDDEGNRTEPTVDSKYSDDEQTNWLIKLGLPNIPNIDVKAKFLGPNEEGKVTKQVKDNDTIVLNFDVPTGAKIFAGTAVYENNYNQIITGARPGDIYLNTETGQVYILQNSGLWQKQDDSNLKGPQGDGVHIAADYRYENPGSIEQIEALKNVTVDYIKNHYTPRPFKNSDVFAITYETMVDNNQLLTSYFFYCVDPTKPDDYNSWGSVLLTSDSANVVKDDGYHNEAPGDSVNIHMNTYSIRYINSLIGQRDIDAEIADRVTFSRDQIDDLIGWGTWDADGNVNKGEEIITPSYTNTYSANEVIHLLSWGTFDELIDKTPPEEGGQ